MSFDLLHIWQSMGLISRLIAFVLVGMAIACVAVTVERMIALAQNTKASRAFAAHASGLIGAGDFEGLIERGRAYERSVMARLFRSVAERFVATRRKSRGGLDPVEAARADAAREQEALSGELRRGMGVLATVGSIAPFVGLLGTVMGIIAAFQGIKDAGSGGLGAVSVGISEALIETALGLVVAIPAVIAFNYLSQRVAGIEGALSRSAGRFLDELEYHHEKPETHSRISCVEAA